jgi:hypothetical protein
LARWESLLIKAADMRRGQLYRLTRGQDAGQWFTLAGMSADQLCAKLRRRGRGKTGREVWICERLAADPNLIVVWRFSRFVAWDGERIERRHLSTMRPDRHLRPIKNKPGFARRKAKRKRSGNPADIVCWDEIAQAPCGADAPAELVGAPDPIYAPEGVNEAYLFTLGRP